MAKQRLPFYDNLKFILIALVLIGHFSGMLIEHDYPLKVLRRWIYLFHMPAFLFVGGIFAKKLCTPQKGLRINVIAFYLVMAFLLYTGLWLEKRIWDPTLDYDLITMGSIPWYFVAMAALGTSTAVVSKIRGGLKTVIPLSVLVAVLAPFNAGFGDFLVLGRICAYAPFYFFGYFLSASDFASFVGKARRMKWPVVVAVLLMVLLYWALFSLPKNITGTMSGLATGHNTYDDMKSFPSSIDAIIRFADIIIAAVMILAISLLTPTKRVLFTDLGSRTLQVYFMHPFIYYPIKGLGWFDPLQHYLPIASWAVIVASVVLACLLALPQWPARLFQKLRQAIRIDNNP